MGQNIYPLSSQNQQYIPLDVIQSKGYAKQVFLAAAPLATRIQLPADYAESLLLVRSTENVIVQFATAATGGLVSSTEFYAFANKDYVLYPHAEYVDLTGDGIAGTTILDYITRFDTYVIPQLLGED